MSCQPPHDVVEGAIFTYLRVHKEYSGNHSSQVQPPIYLGGQGYGVPNQCYLYPVGGRSGPPPLPVRQGDRPLLFSLTPLSPTNQNPLGSAWIPLSGRKGRNAYMLVSRSFGTSLSSFPQWTALLGSGQRLHLNVSPASSRRSGRSYIHVPAGM